MGKYSEIDSALDDLNSKFYQTVARDGEALRKIETLDYKIVGLTELTGTIKQFCRRQKQRILDIETCIDGVNDKINILEKRITGIEEKQDELMRCFKKIYKIGV